MKYITLILLIISLQAKGQDTLTNIKTITGGISCNYKCYVVFQIKHIAGNRPIVYLSTKRNPKSKNYNEENIKRIDFTELPIKVFRDTIKMGKNESVQYSVSNVTRLSVITSQVIRVKK